MGFRESETSEISTHKLSVFHALLNINTKWEADIKRTVDLLKNRSQGNCELLTQRTREYKIIKKLVERRKNSEYCFLFVGSFVGVTRKLARLSWNTLFSLVLPIYVDDFSEKKSTVPTTEAHSLAALLLFSRELHGLWALSWRTSTSRRAASPWNTIYCEKRASKSQRTAELLSRCSVNNNSKKLKWRFNI